MSFLSVGGALLGVQVIFTVFGMLCLLVDELAEEPSFDYVVLPEAAYRMHRDTLALGQGLDVSPGYRAGEFRDIPEQSCRRVRRRGGRT